MSWRFILFAFVCSCVVSACSFSSDEALSSQVAQAGAPSASPLVAITAAPKFRAQPYAASLELDPFDSQRLPLAYKKEWQVSLAQGGLLGAQLRRKKESLEEFPLDTMTMVGRMTTAGKQVALVKVGTYLYSVQLGSHLGQNFGRVVGINDQGLSLRELVQDPEGKWTHRTAILALQERLK